MRRNSLALLTLMAMCVSGPVAAQEFGLSEIRGGVFAHDVYPGFLPLEAHKWRGATHIKDVSVEFLFDLPDARLVRLLGSPRLNLGGTVSLAGRESMAHLAATWQVPVFDTPVYLEGTFGAAIHNGALIGASTPARNLGCRVNFYESAGIGAHLSETVTATLSYEHTSNLGLCSANDGLSNLGVRLGWKF